MGVLFHFQQYFSYIVRVCEIAYGFGGPSEKKCQSLLIFYCKIPILCQSLAKSAQILLVMSDRTDTFRELCIVAVNFIGGGNQST